MQRVAEYDEKIVHLRAMELFYASQAQGSVVTLDQEESGHCIKAT